MNTHSKTAWGGRVGGAILLGAQAVCLATTVDAPDASKEVSNSYTGIISRNAFHLNAPVQPLEEPKVPSPDLPVVTLSGFVETDGQWKVLLAVKLKNGDAKASESTSYLSLTQGDQKGGITLVKADPEREKIDIINSGVPMTLSMKANGFAGHVSVAASAPATRTRAPIPSLQPPTIPNPSQPAAVSASSVTPLGGNNLPGGDALVAGTSSPGGETSLSRSGNNQSVLIGGAVADAGNLSPQSADNAFNASASGAGVSGEGADNNPQTEIASYPASRNPWVLNAGYAAVSHVRRSGTGDDGQIPAAQ
jgi:hypothetical protein